MAKKQRKKFLVLKISDIKKYLSIAAFNALSSTCKQIEDGRRRDGKKAVNRYIICNQDEPYAEKVWEMILQGEDAKRKSCKTVAELEG